MLLVTDVYYHSDFSATAAGVIFEKWGDAKPHLEITTHVDKVDEYEPGSFYKRELPCLLALLKDVQLAGISPQVIIVDGFVTLGADQKPGLGEHLYNALGAIIPVVGVAKTGFHGTPTHCEVQRGESLKPLFVSAAGMSLDDAKSAVLSMHGKHRLPTLLTRVDQLCRGIDCQGNHSPSPK